MVLPTRHGSLKRSGPGLSNAHGPEGAVRCVMIGMAQEDLPERPELLRHVGDLHETCFGVYATVVTPGAVALGDALTLL